MTRRLAFAARALFAVVAVLPLLPRVFAGVPLLDPAGTVLEAWFAFQCERDPLRTVGGVAVCARCFGIYAGFGLGGLIGRPALPLRGLQVWIGGAVLLLLLDVLSEELGLRPAAGALRFTTGVVLAYPVGLVVRNALGLVRDEEFRAPS